MRTAHEIILDPAIRNWVLLPIFLVMFLQGVLRQYVSVLLKDDKKTQLDAISKKSALRTQPVGEHDCEWRQRERCMQLILVSVCCLCDVSICVCVRV